MDADWVMVGAICGPGDAPYPALVLLPVTDVTVEDVWHTAGMCATGSNDVIVDDVWVPEHRLVAVTDIYGGTAPGAELHDAAVYRWPMVPALALTAAMPALGSAELVADLFARRISERLMAYSGAAQKDQPGRANASRRRSGPIARHARADGFGRRGHPDPGRQRGTHRPHRCGPACGWPRHTSCMNRVR